ncbi:hypothetical protein VCHC17A1_4084A, partial [Vibrio cholerae HC-17A1]
MIRYVKHSNHNFSL